MHTLKQSLIHLQCELVAERNGVNPKELSWLQYDILTVLNTKGIKYPSELSEYLKISRSKTSKALKTLKEINYVKQETSSLDGRGLITGITSNGKDFLKEVENGHHHLFTLVEETLSKEEQEQFVLLTNKVIDCLSKNRSESDE